jgi:hypothetical protein
MRHTMWDELRLLQLLQEKSASKLVTKIILYVRSYTFEIGMNNYFLEREIWEFIS